MRHRQLLPLGEGATVARSIRLHERLEVAQLNNGRVFVILERRRFGVAALADADANQPRVLLEAGDGG